MTGPLVSSEWLNANINKSDLVILDVSNPTNKSGTKPEFKNQKIPNSRFFNLTENFSEKNSRFPNTFPSEEQFESECQNLGINNSDIIVVYDNLGIYLSPRVWWMFKVMGHESIYVLNGGLPDWIKKGFPTVENYQSPLKKGTFRASLNAEKVKYFDFIRSNISIHNHAVVDARSEDRFKGIVPEPREGLRSGHIPNSINIPYTFVLENGKYKPEEELLRIFKNAGIDDRPITFSCGSGVTACILLLAAEMVLKNETSIYDGSWTEYGSLTNEDE